MSTTYNKATTFQRGLALELARCALSNHCIPGFPSDLTWEEELVSIIGSVPERMWSYLEELSVEIEEPETRVERWLPLLEEAAEQLLEKGIWSAWDPPSG